MSEVIQTPEAVAPDTSATVETSTSDTSSESTYAPGSIESTAAAALKTLEAAESGDTSSDSVPTSDPKVEETDDIESIQAELTDVMGRKRENRIPYSRVQKIVANAERKVIASVAKELGISKAEAELRLEDVTGALTDRSGRLTAAEQEVQNMAAVAQIMQSDPDAFLQMMVQVNPAYGKFISSPHSSGTDRSSAQAAGEMPQPNYRLPDGTMTYDLAGIQQLMDWQAAQVEQRVAQRYAPVEKTVQQFQEQQRLETIHAQAAERVQRVIEDARTWPGFSENEADILKELKADPKVSLDGAYRKVVFSKLQADRNKVREDVLKEIKSQPRTVTAPVSSSTTPAPVAAKTIEEYAREAASKLGQ